MPLPQAFKHNLNNVNSIQRSNFRAVTIDNTPGYLPASDPYFNTAEFAIYQLRQGQTPDGFVAQVNKISPQYDQDQYQLAEFGGRTGFLPKTSGFFNIPSATLTTIFNTSDTSDDAIVDQSPIVVEQGTGSSGVPATNDSLPPLGDLVDIGTVDRPVVGDCDSTGFREVYSAATPRQSVLVYLDVLGDRDPTKKGQGHRPFNGSPFNISQARSLDKTSVNGVQFPSGEGWIKVERGALEPSKVRKNLGRIYRNIATVLNDPIARELLQENHPTHWVGTKNGQAPANHVPGNQLPLPSHFYNFHGGAGGEAIGPFFQESAGTDLAEFDGQAGDLNAQTRFIGNHSGNLADTGVFSDPRFTPLASVTPTKHLNLVQHVVYYTRKFEREFLGYVRCEVDHHHGGTPPPDPIETPDTTQPIPTPIHAAGGYYPEVVFFGGDVRGATGTAIVGDTGTITSIEIDDLGGSIRSGKTSTTTASLTAPKITLSTPDLATGWFAGRNLDPRIAVSSQEIAEIYEDEGIAINEDQLNSLVTSRCGYFDPLAQTFLVPETNQSLGIFISSIDVCFSAKPSRRSQATTPSSVVMEIRPCTSGSGTPSRDYVVDSSGIAARSEVVDYEITVADGSTILPSFDSGAFTKFQFPVPVYIEPNTRYAFVLMANDSAYKVWVNDVTKALVTDGSLAGTISDEMVTTTVGGRKNHGGTLFKAQSGSQTWEEEETMDMMFRINRCDFTSTSGQVDISVGQDLSTAIDYSSVYFNPSYGFGQFTPSPKNATIEYSQYQTVPSGSSTMAAIDDFSANRDTTMPSAMQLRSSENTGDFRITTKLTRPSSASAISPVINTEDWQCIFNDFSINAGGISEDMIEIISGGSGYQVNDTFSVSGGTGAAAIIKVTAIGNGGVITNMSVTTAGAGFSSAAIVSESSVNGSGAVIRILGEEGGETGGNATFRYISKKISLSSGMDATDLRSFITAKMPKDTSLHVYFRVLSATDSESLDQKSFQKMRQTNPSPDHKFSDFREFEFDTGGDDQITYTDSGGASYSDFSTFQVKVVGYSSSRVKIPSLKDIRVLAVT